MHLLNGPMQIIFDFLLSLFLVVLPVGAGLFWISIVSGRSSHKAPISTANLFLLAGICGLSCFYFICHMPYSHQSLLFYSLIPISILGWLSAAQRFKYSLKWLRQYKHWFVGGAVVLVAQHYMIHWYFAQGVLRDTSAYQAIFADALAFSRFNDIPIETDAFGFQSLSLLMGFFHRIWGTEPTSFVAFVPLIGSAFSFFLIRELMLSLTKEEKVSFQATILLLVLCSTLYFADIHFISILVGISLISLVVKYFDHEGQKSWRGAFLRLIMMFVLFFGSYYLFNAFNESTPYLAMVILLLSFAFFHYVGVEKQRLFLLFSLMVCAWIFPFETSFLIPVIILFSYFWSSSFVWAKAGERILKYLRKDLVRILSISIIPLAFYYWIHHAYAIHYDEKFFSEFPDKMMSWFHFFESPGSNRGSSQVGIYDEFVVWFGSLTPLLVAVIVFFLLETNFYSKFIKKFPEEERKALLLKAQVMHMSLASLWAFGLLSIIFALPIRSGVFLILINAAVFVSIAIQVREKLFWNARLIRIGVTVFIAAIFAAFVKVTFLFKYGLLDVPHNYLRALYPLNLAAYLFIGALVLIVLEAIWRRRKTTKKLFFLFLIMVFLIDGNQMRVKGLNNQYGKNSLQNGWVSQVSPEEWQNLGVFRDISKNAMVVSDPKTMRNVEMLTGLGGAFSSRSQSWWRAFMKAAFAKRSSEEFKRFWLENYDANSRHARLERSRQNKEGIDGKEIYFVLTPRTFHFLNSDISEFQPYKFEGDTEFFVKQLRQQGLEIRVNDSKGFIIASLKL